MFDVVVPANPERPHPVPVVPGSPKPVIKHCSDFIVELPAVAYLLLVLVLFVDNFVLDEDRAIREASEAFDAGVRADDG